MSVASTKNTGQPKVSSIAFLAYLPRRSGPPLSLFGGRCGEYMGVSPRYDASRRRITVASRSFDMFICFRLLRVCPLKESSLSTWFSQGGWATLKGLSYNHYLIFQRCVFCGCKRVMWESESDISKMMCSIPVPCCHSEDNIYIYILKVFYFQSVPKSLRNLDISNDCTGNPPQAQPVGPRLQPDGSGVTRWRITSLIVSKT